MMANRIAIENDKIIYGDYITVGDLIIDTPTKIYSGSTKEVQYYWMGSKDWKTLREGATIWIDGDRLGITTKIVFRNTANEQTPWLIKSAKIKNIPTTKVTTGSISCHGLFNLEIDGVSDQFPGLLKWLPSRKFMSGSFGFHIISNSMFSGHCIEASVMNGGTIKLSGFESQHGFSGVRLSGNSYDVVVNGMTITNFYIHDMGESEGFYLGATHTPPLAKIKNLVIKNGVLARTGSEAIQVQHLIGGTDISDIIIYAADTKWMDVFGMGQDTGIQWVVASGVNKLSNIIVDGFASQGMVPFGSDQDIVHAATGKSFVENILFNDGRNTAMYLHNSVKFGITWNFQKIYFRAFNETYCENTGNVIKPFYISRKWGTDSITFDKIFHDGGKPKVFEDVKNINVGEVIEDKTMPSPKYLNTGFLNKPASTIKHWSQFFAGYFPASKQGSIKVPTTWKIDDIAIDAKEDGSYFLCKCIEAFTAPTGICATPKDNSKFIVLTWDESGIRNDQPNWSKKSNQSYLPPDDLRLASDCFWKQKGFGVKGIIQKEEIIDEYIFNGERFTITDNNTYREKI